MEAQTIISPSLFKRLLFIGAGLSTLLLLSALLVALRTVHQIDLSTAAFSSGQTASQQLIQRLEVQQESLYQRRLLLASRADLIRKEDILKQLAESHVEMQAAFAAATAQTAAARENIRREGQGLLRFTVWLFASCVLLSLLVAFYTVQASAKVFRKLEIQTQELGQLQLQILESQEQVARRFSHELHDELGQDLTALKANLSAMRDAPDASLVDDCLRITDQAVKNVRELSQLLRPTVLDDFGLDAALEWLTANFSQRTKISVHYVSSLGSRRLGDFTETPLFRIAQEALTNVARHSGASEVKIALRHDDHSVTLEMEDNGRGFSPDAPRGQPSLGLVGMRTRARGAGGAFRLESAPGRGVKIEVTCPVL